MRVLVLNAGSSSLKASMVEVEPHRRLASTQADWPASEEDANGAETMLQRVLDELEDHRAADAVGHRVVHGGDDYHGPARVDERLIREVERLDRLAPLHNRRAARVIRAAQSRLGDIPQVACFDTAFHATMPEEARRYALPDDWVQPRGIRRFGFHGLSVAWSVTRAAELLGRPSSALSIVVAHLGAGSSVTAVADGQSVATSMGFTPLEGLVMGTRSGSVDPGVLLELLRTGVTPDELASGIAARSGLLALSGTTADVRTLQARADSGDERARVALSIYARSAAAAVASAASALDRLDALVFTGGIGENSEAIRGAVVARLGVLGVPGRLHTPAGDAIVATGPPAVLVVEAQEDVVVSREVARTLQ